MARYLVFDWGGTLIKHAVMDGDARILEQGERPTPDPHSSTKEDFLAAIDDVVAAHRDGVEGIAVSMPGMVDDANGHCRSAGHLSYLIGSTIGDEFRERYGLPCSVENDGRSAALAELWRGSLRGRRNAAFMGLGTAVAGALVLDGRLHTGAHASAGEFSFLVCDWHGAWDDKQAYWAKSGGVGGLCRLVAERTGEDPEALDGRIVFGRANAGDADALAGLDAYCDGLAVQLHNINTLLDLEVIAVGGGISRQPLLIERLSAAIARMEGSCPMRPKNPSIPVPEVTACTFFNEANLIGALYHFIDQHGSD